ncbi:TPM domain-containing protein [Hymenobacter properus]|uniref:TPM domain-containing protein n=1 Tax=Hymenobacter properus TaxID=2791026 RepID=A0A931FK60_9BACT|nr:TPM domain-containing protein [Hymenobacter properus]MBF9142678.1 TPM domain-containing protein [Hymenobacter properus]MBR7721486.1 TPM domain-containing protein [Microvirga sp. SRT04]
MSKLLFLVFLFVSAGLGVPAAAQTGTSDVPPRPNPFHFVNDEANLMAPADAKKLDNGLRRYANNNGTQIVVVTVPSLGGRDVAAYGKAIGTAWGVGQKDKNNGVVVLISAQDRKLSIQPGSGLQSTITPEVTQQVIAQMGPNFKQGNYFAGLRTGLNTLMAAADPNAGQRQQAGSPATGAGTAASTAATEPTQSSLDQQTTTSTTTNDPIMAPPAEPASSGPGMGTLLIGGLIIGGILWFVIKMFRGRSAANNQASYNNPSGGTPNFLPNRPNGPSGGYSQAPGNYGPGYGQAPASGGGMGVGGMLATGAAAAAGAYLGNRMASGHDTSGNSYMGDGNNSNLNAGAGAAGMAGAAGSSAGSDYFSNRDGGTADSGGTDYFSDANTASDNSSDYFSSDDNSSYDDSSSGDMGGGGFDSGDDNSGSW